MKPKYLAMSERWNSAATIRAPIAAREVLIANEPSDLSIPPPFPTSSTFITKENTGAANSMSPEVIVTNRRNFALVSGVQ